MGLFSVDVGVEGPTGREPVSMLIDSGATYSAISAALAQRLGLPQNRQEDFEFADGRNARLPVVEARIRVNGRETATLLILTGGARCSAPMRSRASASRSIRDGSDSSRPRDSVDSPKRLDRAVEQMKRRLARIEAELLAVLGVQAAQLAALIVLLVRR
jgi:hypothetical protein